MTQIKLNSRMILFNQAIFRITGNYQGSRESGAAEKCKSGLQYQDTEINKQLVQNYIA